MLSRYFEAQNAFTPFKPAHFWGYAAEQQMDFNFNCVCLYQDLKQRVILLCENQILIITLSSRPKIATNAAICEILANS